MESRLLSINEVAIKLGMEYRTCRGLIKAGQIKSAVIGKRHKVREEWVDEYINKNIFEPERVYCDRKPGRKSKN